MHSYSETDLNWCMMYANFISELVHVHVHVHMYANSVTVY